jgi:hypothetical protein
MTGIEIILDDCTTFRMMRDVWLRDPEISPYTASLLRDLFQRAENRGGLKNGKYLPIGRKK